MLELLLRNPRAVITRERALERGVGRRGEAENVVDRTSPTCAASSASPADPHRARRRLRPGAMRLHSLRLRVALAAAAGVFVAVAAARHRRCQQVVDHELRTAQDRALRTQATNIARLSASAPALLTRPARSSAAPAASSCWSRCSTARGRIVARSSALGGRVLRGDAVAAAIARGRPATRASTCGATRCGSTSPRWPAGGGQARGGAVLVAATVGEIERTARARCARSSCSARSWPRCSAPLLAPLLTAARAARRSAP